MPHNLVNPIFMAKFVLVVRNRKRSLLKAGSIGLSKRISKGMVVGL